VVLSCSRFHQVCAIAGATIALTGSALAAPVAGPDVTAALARGATVIPKDTLQGKSGKLLARIFSSQRVGGIRVLRELFGDTTSGRPGIYTAASATPGGSFSFISLLPFSAKQRGRVGSYFIGTWPREQRNTPGLPEGFIEVTADNQHTLVSEHFRLRDFLTHDQQSVWPKYLVLQEALVDKLELVISDLTLRGHHIDHVSGMSGFRTPQYNVKGVGRGGRALDSRHQYGDAADIFVDSDRNGQMDDLNRDGRVDVRDTRIILQSVERIEGQFPDLIGGAGLYPATRAHGPFIHVDVRGHKARWGLS
jgi:uncharacterized protein YcbK (DUF882 family)